MAATPVPKNIYIVGAQCTGKTTLVNGLQRRFQSIARDLCIDEPGIISEVARKVLKKHPIETENIRSDPQQSLNLQKLILIAQAVSEEEVLARYPWFICDRSGFDPLVYARRYAGPEAAKEMLLSADWSKLRSRMADSVVVVCEAGVPWLFDDGVRLMPEDGEDWTELHQLFCEMLGQAGIAYHVLPRNIAGIYERTEFVVSLWKSSGVNGVSQASRI